MNDQTESNPPAMESIRSRLRVGFAIGACLCAGFAAEATGQVDGSSGVEAVRDYLLYFEPDLASQLEIHLYDGRLPDLTEEGLAARVRGYRDHRASLDPNTHKAASRYLAQRVSSFDDVRSWSWSPAFYLDAIGRSLWSLEESPGLPSDLRIEALTARLRQVSTGLEAAKANVFLPSQFLVRDGMERTADLQGYLQGLEDAYGSRLTEGGAKWALEQAIRDAVAALDGFRTFLADELLPVASRQPGMGEDALGAWAIATGYDGVLHGAEETRGARSVVQGLMDRGGLASAEGTPLSPHISSDRDRFRNGVEAAMATMAPNNPIDLSLTWGSSPGTLRSGELTLAANRVGGPGQLVTVYLTPSQSPLDARAASTVAELMFWSTWGAVRGSDPLAPSSDALLEVLHWKPALRVFAQLAVYETMGSEAIGRAALAEAFGAVTLGDLTYQVHRGTLSPSNAATELQRVLGWSAARARQELAAGLTDPSRVFGPVEGVRLWETYRFGQWDSPDDFLRQLFQGQVP